MSQWDQLSSSEPPRREPQVFVIYSGISSAGLDVVSGKWSWSHGFHFPKLLDLQSLLSPSSIFASKKIEEEIKRVSEAEWLDIEGWKRPTPKARATATAAANSLSWQQMFGEPNITTSPEGRVVFEWWKGDNKLTIYAGEDGLEYIKVWGADTENEMEDGFIADVLDTPKLVSWLNG